MNNHNQNFSKDELSAERLSDLLKLLSAQGHTQTQIAQRAALPPQYISDIKQGRRPMTELVARRIGDEFDVNFQWLLGQSDTMEKTAIVANEGNRPWLPLFREPIEGEPRSHKKWSGAGLEISGVPAGRIALYTQPYILQYGRDDVQGRLQRGDLILITQEVRETAEIQVVRYRRKLHLARREVADGAWFRVANNNELPADSPVLGHCVGVIWSPIS